MIKDILQRRKEHLKFDVEVPGGGIMDVDLYDELVFSEEDLMDHLICQAGLMSWWTSISLRLESQLRGLKRQYERWYLPKYERARNYLYQEKKNPTVKSIENCLKVMNSEEYDQWQEEMEKLESKLEFVKEIPSFFKEKGQMMVQTAKYRTSEMFSIHPFEEEEKEKDEAEKLKRKLSLSERIEEKN